MLFRAKIALRSVCDITPQLLEKLGVCGLLLDIDNTLTTHDNPVPAAGVEAWVDLAVSGVQQPPAPCGTFCQTTGAGLRLRGKKAADEGLSGGSAENGTVP